MCTYSNYYINCIYIDYQLFTNYQVCHILAKNSNKLGFFAYSVEISSAL